MMGVRMYMKAFLAIVLVASCGTRHGNPLNLLTETIAPPAPFDKLALGMTIAEATTVLPELTGEPTTSGYAALAVKDVPVTVVFEHSRLHEIMLKLERPSFEADLVKLWGPSHTVERGIVDWNGPVWRANHSCTKAGDVCAVIFERPARPLTPAFFGKVPQPPGALAKLHFKMPFAEADAIAPALVGEYATTGNDLGVDGVTADLVVTDDKGVLAIGMTLDAKGTEMVRAAWGKEVPSPTRVEPDRACWQGDPWRACIAYRSETLTKIEFDRFLPLATVLGEGADITYFTGLIGSTPAEVEAKLGKLGAPHCAACPRAYLPDSDFGRMFLDVDLTEGKVASYDLYVDYAGEDERAAAFAVLVAKWGATAKLPSAVAGDKEIVLRPKAPRVTITDSKNDRDEAYMWKLAVAP